MKNLASLLLCLTILSASSLNGQDAPAKANTKASPAQPSRPTLTKFDLDFPGGTPADLVAAIQKAMGRPLNAIIAAEYANRRLPPVKVNQVDAQQLFDAMSNASASTVLVQVSWNNTTTYNSSDVRYGFIALNQPLTDDTIWTFYERGTAQLPNLSRFYLLTPYLDSGLTVDDITTAIQTGWRLQGNAAPPKLSFHKETKLLIAVGNPNELETIDSALKALDARRVNPPAETEAKTKP